MSTSGLKARLGRLEAQILSEAFDLADRFVIQTIADKGDEAEHARQAAEQKREGGYVPGQLLLHIRRNIVDPSPQPHGRPH